MQDRNQIFQEFIKSNPALANPAGHHRRLADWAYDTKYRDQVASGAMNFQDALVAARDDAFQTLPPPHEEKAQNINSMTGADAAIAQMAIGRNQPIPAPSGRTEAPPGSVAVICAQHAGLKTGN